MKIRRFDNVVAFSNENEQQNSNLEYFAYHIENMEVASISDEAFNSLNEISFETPISNNADNTAHFAIEKWNSEVNENAKTAKIENRIRSISLNVNQICNLKCNYCAAGGDGTYGRPTKSLDLNETKKQIEFLVSKLIENDSFSINFVGGEPLLHPNIIIDIYDFVTKLNEKNKFRPYFRIVTNGTMLSDSSIELLAKRNFEITVSIDGEKEINDLVRPSKDGSSTTDNIVLGVNKIKQLNTKSISLNASILTSKTNTCLYKNFLFVESLGFDSFELAFENSESDEQIIYTFVSEYKKILDYLWLKEKEAGIRKITTVDHYFKLLDSQTRVENHCGSGKSYIMIDSQNKAYNCVWEANHPDRTIGKGTNLTKTDPMLLKPLIEINNCTQCWAKYLCGGGCMYINELHTGDKHLKSKSFCLRTRHLISLVILYYKRARF